MSAVGGRAAERALLLGYRAGWRVVRALPEPVAQAAFRAGADAATRRGGRAVRQLTANLRRVVGPAVAEPELAALVRAGVRSYARYWCEAFQLPSWSHDEIRRRFTLDGEDRLRAALAAGTGAVVALPHAGNWDLAGSWACVTGMPLVTVAERLRPEELYQRFLAYRRRLGMEIVPLTGGSKPPLDTLTDRLAAGRLVVLLADRDLSARGVPVEFFGARATMPPGPALLALRTGAPLFVCSLWNEPRRTRARLDGPLPLPSDGSLADRVAMLTQAIADRLAAGIAEHPEDWHMLQRLWSDDRRPAAARPVPATET